MIDPFLALGPLHLLVKTKSVTCSYKKSKWPLWKMGDLHLGGLGLPSMSLLFCREPAGFRDLFVYSLSFFPLE